MVLITDKTKCCGCTACFSICPHKCIVMEVDNEGFQYPIVNDKDCINCHACENVCPVNSTQDSSNKTSLYAAIQYKDEEKRTTSTAGGVFSLIADSLIEKGATIFAVGYANNMVVCHKPANYGESLEEFRGSKYVQSTLGDTFKQIKKLIREKKVVLFTGTPCQVYGLKKYVGDSPLLYKIDLLCLGVSSPMLYMRWIEYLQRKYRDIIVNVQFRNKNYGYATPNVKVYFKNRKPIESIYDTRVHNKLFFDNYNVRPSCYECNFREIPRVSDFTIGDFTDIGNYNSSMDDSKGTTRTWVHTEKGKELLRQLEGKATVFIINETSSNIMGGSKKQIYVPERREEFWKDVEQSVDYLILVSKYEPKSMKDELIRLVRPLMNSLPFKSILQKYLRKKRDEKFKNMVEQVNR